jgi:hypothetical protein
LPGFAGAGAGAAFISGLPLEFFVSAAFFLLGSVACVTH